MRNMAITLAFALYNSDLHPVAVDITNLKIANFTNTHASRVDQRQQHTMLEPLRSKKQSAQFLTRKDNRQLTIIAQSWQPQSSVFQAIQPEEKAKTIHRVLEVGTAGSFLLCNRKHELVHFVWIQVQQRFLKVQTDHSAQLTATP
jgi:ribosome biogenesis protein Tsr3